MATRRVLTVDEVVEELQNSDSDNDDDSEDDFDGYLDEEEMQQRWMGEMEGNSDLEGNGSEREESNSVKLASVHRYVCTCVCVCVCIWCVHACVYTCMWVQVCMCVYMCVCM